MINKTERRKGRGPKENDQKGAREESKGEKMDVKESVRQEVLKRGEKEPVGRRWNVKKKI